MESEVWTEKGNHSHRVTCNKIDNGPEGRLDCARFDVLPSRFIGKNGFRDNEDASLQNHPREYTVDLAVPGRVLF